MEQRLRKIVLLLLDVDGVMTDGRIVYDDRGGESKAFHVRDGHGLKLLQRAGFTVGIITGRESPVVERRAAELGIGIVHQGAKDKLIAYRQTLEQQALVDEQVAYVGDDLVDLPLLRRVGFAVTVADAPDYVKAEVHHVTRRPGGHGAVREVCDLLLRGRDGWDQVTRRYFAD